MLHHLSFGVADLRRSAAFYDATIGTLGFVRVWSDFEGGADDQAVGYGRAGGGDRFAIKQRTSAPLVARAGLHVAFAASEREAVHRFHAAALAHGGRDNAAPGPRPQYGADYYAAFVVDPDGYHVEVVVDVREA